MPVTHRGRINRAAALPPDLAAADTIDDDPMTPRPTHCRIVSVSGTKIGALKETNDGRQSL